MSVFPNAALTSGQYQSLRGTSSIPPRWHGAVYASVCPNTTIYSARVNGTPSGTSFASITFDGGSGTLANVQVGMTVLISATNDAAAAYWVGRVRLAPGAATLFINETSASIADNDYIFVIDDYRLWPKLARDVGGVQYKDYDVGYQGLPPVIVGLQQAYAGFVDPTSSKLRLAFSIANSYAAESGASLSSYSWTFPASATLVSGSITSNACTMDFSATTGVWCSVTVTDSGGRTQTRRFFVHAAERSGANAPLQGFSGANITGDLAGGWSASIDAFEGIDGLLDNTLITLWTEESYNGTAGALLAATNDPRNVVFVGRVARDSAQGQGDEKYSYTTSTRLELEGVSGQMARLHGGLISMLWDAAADAFDEIKVLTLWRAIVHFLHFHSTALTLCDLTFDSTATTYQLRGLTTQGGNLISVVNDIGESINAALEFAPSGAIRVIRDPNYLSNADRATLTTLGAFTVEDFIGVSIDVDNVQRVGRVDGSGGAFDSANVSVTPLLSVAPGMANDYPEATAQLGRQVLQADVSQPTAQSELNTRVGHHLARLNGGAVLNVNMPDGYGFLIPTAYGWYTWALDTTTNNRGREYTASTRWLLQNASYTYDNAAGTRAVQATFTQETTGSPGDTVQYPAPGDIPIDVGVDIPPIDIGLIPVDPVDDVGDNPGDDTGDGPWVVVTKRKDGNIVLIWNASRVYLTTNFLTTSPAWTDVTPDGGYTIVSCAFAPDFRGGAYCLINDGTDSRVAYSSDIIAGAAWEIGTSISGLYTELRCMSTPGQVAIYSPDLTGGGGTWTETFDFTVNNGGFSVSVGGGSAGTYTAGVGWVAVDGGVDGGGIYRRNVDIQRTISATTITEYSMTYDLTKGSYSSGAAEAALLADSGAFPRQSLLHGSASSGTNLTYTYTGSISGITVLQFRVTSSFQGSATYSGSGLIKSVSISGTGTNPFSGGGTSGAVARFSTDYGVVFGSEISVGTTPGSVGGFDVVRVGNYSYAAAVNQAKVATTAGGAYANATGGTLTGVSPSLLFVPLFDWGSSTVKNTAASYDWLMGATGLDTSHCLWRVNSAGTRTGITPTGVTTMPTNNSAFTWKGTHMAVIGNVSGTRKLFTSSTIGSTDTWTDRGALGASANYIRIRRTSQTGQHLFWVDGSSARYRSTFAGTTKNKTYPESSTLLGLDVFG